MQNLNSKSYEVSDTCYFEDGLFGDIGELMVEFLDGEAGERFARAAADFCQHQQFALK